MSERLSETYLDIVADHVRRRRDHLGGDEMSARLNIDNADYWRPGHALPARQTKER